MLRGDFVWSGDSSAATLTVFRFSEIEEERRDADALPPEEIAVAGQWLLSRGLSMPEDDLLRETARAFGLARLGQKVSDRMLAGIELLVSSGTCEREAGRVVWRG